MFAANRYSTAILNSRWRQPLSPTTTILSSRFLLQRSRTTLLTCMNVLRTSNVPKITMMGRSHYPAFPAPVDMAAALLKPSFGDPRPQAEQSFSSIQHVLQGRTHSGPKGKREMSRQQWEEMKPLIQRIYIDENKPFPYLAHILVTEYGFEPTYDHISAFQKVRRLTMKLESVSSHAKLTNGVSARMFHTRRDEVSFTASTAMWVRRIPMLRIDV